MSKERYSMRLRKRDLNTLNHLSNANDKPVARYIDEALEDLFIKLGVDPNDFVDPPVKGN